eukprot:COSAG01_NODE_9852_length_2319_cov_11.887838_2_plen_155_part_00
MIGRVYVVVSLLMIVDRCSAARTHRTHTTDTFSEVHTIDLPDCGCVGTQPQPKRLFACMQPHDSFKTVSRHAATAKTTLCMHAATRLFQDTFQKCRISGISTRTHTQNKKLPRKGRGLPRTWIRKAFVPVQLCTSDRDSAIGSTAVPSALRRSD